MRARRSVDQAACTSIGGTTSSDTSKTSLFIRYSEGRLHLLRYVAHANDAGRHHPRIDAAQIELPAERRVDELHRVGAESRHEFLAAGVWLGRHFNHRRPQGEACARGEILETEIQVHEQLIA